MIYGEDMPLGFRFVDVMDSYEVLLFRWISNIKYMFSLTLIMLPFSEDNVKEKFEKKLKEKIIEELPNIEVEESEEEYESDTEVEGQCHNCEKELCEDNIMECEECNKCFCDDCINNCPTCDDICCEMCVKNHCT